MAFEKLATEIFGRPLGNSSTVLSRRYRGLFGVTPHITNLLWSYVRNKLPRNTHERHLLWALLFLKCYPTDTVLSALCCADESTVRYWIWTVLESIANLRLVWLLTFLLLRLKYWLYVQVEWDMHLSDRTFYACLASVDATDVRIYEPSRSIRFGIPINLRVLGCVLK